MDLEITQPFRLAALVVLPLLVFYWWRGLPGFGWWQRTTSLVIRVLLVVLLVLALCGLELTSVSRQLFVVFAVDESSSISDASSRAAGAFIDEALKHATRNRSDRLPFALGPCEGASHHGTDLAAAIAAAQAATQSEYVPRIVLLSDGNQTAGDALAAAAAATMPIWTVPLRGSREEEVYVSAIETKAEVRRGEPFFVDVVVQSTQEGEGTVRLLEATKPVATETRHATRGENRFRFRHVLRDQSEAVLTAEVDGFADTLPENNRASTLVLITEGPRVLLIEGRPGSTRPLAATLKQQYIDVETRPPAEMPAGPAGLEDYELVMLSNVPAASLDTGQMEALRQYVRDLGGGLIVVGGDRSLTAGGYRETVLEEILPVRCEVGPDRPEPSLAMVLVIDRSDSMKGESIELAKQATRLAVEKLAAGDQVGVIAFEDDSRWISPIQPCSDKQPVLERIDTIRAEGGTNLYPAMEKAYLALHEAFADRKHMIVLSDGLSHPDDFQTLAKEIAASGITVSTVAVGEKSARQLLQDIARHGKGQYYYCRDAAALPRVFVLEATTAGKVGIVEELVSAHLVDAAEVFREIEPADVPPLLGYVQTIAKPKGQVVLRAENGDPLLAWWSFGRGRSVAFTSTVQNAWAPLWLEWPGLGPFWGRLVRHAMRDDEPEGFALNLERKNDRARLTLDAVDGHDEYINGAEGTLGIVDHNRKGRQVPLVQIAPGRYAAEFSVPGPGPYRLEATLSRDGRPICARRRGLVVGYPDELRLGPADKDLLKSIAETSGGRYDPRPVDVFAPPQQTVRRTTPCWPCLLTLAALIFLVDLALKRIDLAGRRS